MERQKDITYSSKMRFDTDQVRENERQRGALRRLSDLRGRRVGTLGGTIAYEILLQAERRHALEAVSYDDAGLVLTFQSIP